jgi:hypothetical protein
MPRLAGDIRDVYEGQTARMMVSVILCDISAQTAPECSYIYSD